jgi:uncharacterized protein YdaU (DUF1376 family)
MRRPWMPLYIPDYLADTAHLSTVESGAYLHLIMHYWMKDGLPDDDAQLARIVKLSMPDWLAMRPVISAMFMEGWRHSRIDKEMREAEEAYERRAEAGRKGNEVKARQRERNASALRKQPQPHPPKDDGGGRASAQPSEVVSREAISIADELCRIAGHDPQFMPPGWCGAAMRVQTWLSTHPTWTREIILTAARGAMANKTDGPPNTVNYFEKPIARLVQQQAAPVKTSGGTNETGGRRAPASGWQRSRDDFRAAREELKAGIAAAERERADTGGGEGG